MSENYNSFAAAAFGPVLAEVAREEGFRTITPALRRRAQQGWNLTPAALEAICQEAARILAEDRS